MLSTRNGKRQKAYSSVDKVSIVKILMAMPIARWPVFEKIISEANVTSISVTSVTSVSKCQISRIFVLRNNCNCKRIHFEHVSVLSYAESRKNVLYEIRLGINLFFQFSRGSIKVQLNSLRSIHPRAFCIANFR